jgi:cytochrome c-type biogenesis protein CcmE
MRVAMSHKKAKVGLTAIVLAAALGGLFWSTLSEGTEYYKHVDEVMRSPEQWYGKRLQLHGFVEPGSYMLTRNRLDRRFTVSFNGHSVPASHTGIVPDTFKEGAEVVLKGTLGPKGFSVDSDGVMAKCPSKYEQRKGGPVGAPPPASTGTY